MPTDLAAVLESADYTRRRRNELYWLKQNKFYATTPFAGFVFIQVAKSKLESIFWYIILLLFFVWTVRDVRELFIEYYSGKSSTRVEISHDNSTMFLPNITICVNNNWHLLDAELQSQSGSEHLAAEGFGQLQALNMLKASLASVDTREKFLNNDWDFLLVAVAMKTLSIEGLCYERLFSNISNESVQPGMLYNIFTAYRNMLNVTLEELSRKFTTEFLKLHGAGLYLMDFEGPNWFEFENGSMRLLAIPVPGLFTDRVKTCFLLTHKARQIQLDLDFQKITDYLAQLPISAESAQQISNSSVSVLMGLAKGAAGNYAVPLFEASHDLRTTAVMTTTASFEGEKSTYWPAMECLARREANLSDTLCGCVPMSARAAFPKIYNHTPLCGCTQDINCVAEHQNWQPLKLNECPTTWDRKLYQTNVQLAPMFKRAEGSSTLGIILRINVCFPRAIKFGSLVSRRQNTSIAIGSRDKKYVFEMDSYPVFVEQTKSHVEFLSELGGMIDLWLGASVIGVVHLILFLLKQIMYLFTKDTKTNKHVHRMMDSFRSTSLFAGAITAEHDTSDLYDDQLETKIEDCIQKLNHQQNSIDAILKNQSQVDEWNELRAVVEQTSRQVLAVQKRLDKADFVIS